MQVRIANPDDAFDIASVHVASWQTAYRGILPDEFLDHLSVTQRLERWRDILSDPDQFSVVAVERDRIVGFASGGSERSGKSADQGEIYALYLLQEFRGRGIGRRLFQAAAEVLMNRGNSSLLVWVLCDNPYRDFYVRLGGELVRQRSIEIAEMHLQEAAYEWSDL